MSRPTRWAILTGEYPPQPGGVSDYTALVAEGLATAGDRVTVYAPPEHPSARKDGVHVIRLDDRFGRIGRAQVDAMLRTDRPDRILIQYVPHAFGRKAMNLPFIRWLTHSVRHIAPLWVMFHEVAFPLLWWPPQYAILGGVTRHMAACLSAAAERVFISIPGWAPILHKLNPNGVSPEWLPVPCTISADASAEAVAAVKKQHAPNGPLIGHFGTFGSHIVGVFLPTLVSLLDRCPTIKLVLMGRGSKQFQQRVITEHPYLVGRVTSVGELSSLDVSAHLRACDLLIQPYPDGVSTRRTSIMAGLANGVPIVTNMGFLSESLWLNGAVAAAPTPDPKAIVELARALLSDDCYRTELGHRGNELYRDMFAIEHSISRLRTCTLSLTS